VSDPSVARRYARFVLGLTGADIPAPVTAKAAVLTLDTLGSCLASSREDFGRAVLESAERLGGPPESTLIGTKA
jgi:2-methylcitrate dehydratase PrpD